MTAQQNEALLAEETSVNTPIPGMLNVIRRNGTITPFDSEKIKVAITKVFLAIEGELNNANPEYIHDVASKITKCVNLALRRRHADGGIIHIETIQDQVELELVRSEHHKAARSYVLYREERRKQRIKTPDKKVTSGKKIISIFSVRIINYFIISCFDF